VGVGIDSTTTNSAIVYGGYTQNSGTVEELTALYKGYPGLGYHKLTWLECGHGASTGTTTWYSNSTGYKSGMVGELAA
jgi:hypothetical protein